MSLKKRPAAGGDAVKWDTYAEKLEDNLQDLHRRVHSGAYRALPSRRVFIPVRHEVMYRDSKSRIYSAQNQVQVIIYSALPAGDKQSIEVLDTLWADAYLLKAYALTELKRVPEAQKALDSAITLSPMN